MNYSHIVFFNTSNVRYKLITKLITGDKDKIQVAKHFAMIRIWFEHSFNVNNVNVFK